ncbi:thioesterase family protein [Zhihengliuella salsuginis]|uniref:Thioesterase n=1 Tax=Zhihengliuella salsuginis TaxID=578222 RepID=A0ABQ3GNK2_9MICC|nr:thioesterase family protein [Zhihengliuella salsuginis]GHD13954.1 thioesterase [Zhihengliuella salsuginis]
MSKAPTHTNTAQQAELPELAVGDFFYEDLGDGHYRSTVHAQGAWNPHEQHMAPATGIIAHELERFQPREDMRMARVSLDIHGIIHGGEFHIETRMIRPGRTIELIEAEMITQGRTSIVARAWRLKTGDSSEVHAVEDTTVAHPENLPAWEGMSPWPGGYIEGLDFRVEDGHRAGRGTVWLRSSFDMVSSGPTTPLVRLLGMVDTANGVAPRVEPGPESWMFPNVDLQIHMHRAPEGEWLGVQAQQTYGTDGIGLTSGVLHDVKGPFGRSEQILTVRPMPGRTA